MKVKNISKGNFNLTSGKLEPGKEGDCTLDEFKVLASSGKIEVVQDKPVAKKMAAKKPANG